MFDWLRRLLGQPTNPFSNSTYAIRCEGCHARDEHIETLSHLLAHEQHQRDSLTDRMLGVVPASQTPEQETQVRLGGLAPTLSQVRSRAYAREAEGRKQFDEKRRIRYENLERDLNERIASAVRNKPKTESNFEATQDRSPEFVSDTDERSQDRAALE